MNLYYRQHEATKMNLYYRQHEATKMNLKKVMKALHTWELEAASAGREEEIEHLSRFVQKQITRIEKKKAKKKASALSFTPQDA